MHEQLTEQIERSLPEGDPGGSFPLREPTRWVQSARLLWDQRRWLLRFTGYGLLISMLLAFLIPKCYDSAARLMPPDSQSGSSLAALAALSGRAGFGGAGALAGDFLGIKSSGALFVGILRSRTVEDRIIQKFDLKSVYWAFTLEAAREKLEDRTSVTEDRKSGIITITVTDTDPQRATAMARAYIEELNRLVAEVSTSAARRERIFIEERLKVVKQELDQAAKEFSQFASKNAAIDIKEQGRAMVDAAATLQGQLVAALTELEGLKQVYTAENVRVRSVQARIEEIQKQLEKLGGTSSGIAGVGEKEGELYPSIRKLPLLGVPYANLLRRTKIAETLFELLTQQYELAKVQEAKEIPSVKVLDPPVVPEKRSYPPRLLILILGAMLSFALGAFWVLVVVFWEKTDPMDPRRELAGQVFATVKSSLGRWSANGRRLSNGQTTPWTPTGGSSDKGKEF